MPKGERHGKTLLTCGNVRPYIVGFQANGGRDAEGSEWLFMENFGRL